MAFDLPENECRVLGSLIEKQLTTPEYYPLTLNALTAACNQKSNREPVMSLDETSILAAIDSLRDKNLVYLFNGSGSRAVKYKHMLPNVLELEPEAVAVITLLLLRGPQTVGELRGRSDRLYEFSGLGDVQETLDDLERRGEALVMKLERQPGQKEARYAHLLSGVPENIAAVPLAAAPSTDRIASLEQNVAELRAEVDSLKQIFADFKRQFE